MDRGVIVGGGLIAASFVVAVLLNRSAHEEPTPAERELPADVCDEVPGQRTPGPGGLADTLTEECKRARDSLKR